MRKLPPAGLLSQWLTTSTFELELTRDGTGFSDQPWVESAVSKLLKDREEKQLRVSVRSHDIRIRTQVERLAKLLLWADPVVRAAVSTQTYAALAWSSVSILLPVDLAAAAGDYKRYKDVNRERLPGTCEWFLTDDRFRKWLDSKLPGLLWVSAGPGRGKSVLSRCLVDEGQLNAPTTITIIRSDVVAYTTTTSTVCYFFFKDGGMAAWMVLMLWLFLRNTLHYGKSSLCIVSPGAGEINCVFDVLDECKEESRRDIIETIEKLYVLSQSHSRHSSLKILVTSRPYDDIEKLFQKFSSYSAYLRLEGDDKSEQTHQEIDLVIDARLQDIAHGFTTDDRRKISERLKGMKNRTYLWLHLTLDIVEKSSARYGRRSALESLLSNLPYRVTDAYEKILSRSIDRTQTEILLQIVLAARHPLTLGEAIRLPKAFYLIVIASYFGLTARVEQLIGTEKVDVESRNFYYDKTPLLWVAENGHKAVVKLLLDTGKVDVDSKDPYSRASLSRAAGSGNEAVVKLLLDTGKVDVESRDSKFDQAPLSWAAENGHEL
ncbi:hypothetical protein ETB97_002027 [Aspergillus alliaceus]|uniref:Nephrocystin 3-like N-terminal domain-containing protein n=1 Tax=Petromyces alliaceus TaxID=209559 RepID=A0A8H6A584_PETAA|nr:hypothetical protein ETB97_002027 [Aspergillus burnettii]